MTVVTAAHVAPFREPDGFTRFGHRVGLSLLALVSLYSVYAIGAFMTLESTSPFSHRLVTLLGMGVFPLPLLAAPATYFAALDRFHLYGETGSDMRRIHWKLLGLIALATGGVLVAAPLGYDYAVRTVIGPSEAALFDDMAANNARLMVPLAVALFVIVAGVGGAVTGRATRGLTAGARYAARWTVGAALVGSFLATMVLMAELIAMHGALSPPWLALAPPLVPFVLVCVLAWRDCVRVVQSVAERVGLRRGGRADPGEIAALVNGLTQVAAPAVSIADGRVHEIVAGLTATAQPATGSRPERGRRKPGDRRWGMMAGGFAGSWAYLSAGFLWLGGAGLSQPTVVSALSAGFIGAAGAVLASR